MSDADDPMDELRAKAAAAVAKRAAEGVVEDTRRNWKKRIALGVIGLLVVVGLIGLMLHYWYWSLLLGLVGGAALYGRRRWRARRASRKKLAVTKQEAPALAPKVRIAEPEAAPAEDLDASIDDDLAELKARLKR